MIEWQSIDVTEPPITRIISMTELDECISEKKMFHPMNYPLHTQAVERAIKVVTEASLQVCGNDAREGLIQARLGSRDRISSFESKKDYYNK